MINSKNTGQVGAGLTGWKPIPESDRAGSEPLLDRVKTRLYDYDNYF